jgi:hypothetical protein
LSPLGISNQALTLDSTGGQEGSLWSAYRLGRSVNMVNGHGRSELGSRQILHSRFCVDSEWILQSGH